MRLRLNRNKVITDNPLLAEGEPGFEISTNTLKIGDGATSWSSLKRFLDTGDLATLDNLIALAEESGDITALNNAINVLLAAKAKSTVPSYAGNRNNPYDATRSFYNLKASNTRKIRAALGRAQSGTGLAQFVVPGDSISANFIGTGYAQLSMWPRVLRQELALLGVPSGGTGFVSAADAIAADAGCIDPRWTFTGSWSNTDSYNIGNALGATATFSTQTVGGEIGTAMDLFFFGSATGFNITVDGAIPAQGNVAMSQGSYNAAGSGSVTPGGSLAVVKLTVTGLASGTHNIKVSCAGGATYIIGANLYSTTGLVVNNIAMLGGRALYWADRSSPVGYPTVRTAAVGVNQDAVIIPLGINGILSGDSIQTIINSITTIRGYWPSADVILVAEPHSGSIALATWQSYVSALYDLADTLDCPLLDLFDRFGTNAQATASGVMGDNTHLNKAGQGNIGRTLAMALAS